MNKSNVTFCFIQLYHISEQGGGAEVQAAYLSKELVRRGYEVHYICKTVTNDKVDKLTNLDGVKIHWIKNRKTSAQDNIHDIYSILQLVKPSYIIERMSSAFGKAIYQFKGKYESKYIWICTDNQSSKRFKNTIQLFQKLSLLKYLYALPNSIKTDLIRQKAIKCADYIFSQNEDQKRMIEKNFNRSSNKMISGHPIPNKNISFSERFNNKTILWCANFGSHKRPELFIELAKEMEDTDYQFIMVGGHSDQNYLDRLLQNKPDNLKTTGQIPFDEALNYFNKASILVNTSLSEGFSNTYIQGWLRDIPSIVFGADPDHVIANNKIGYDVSNINEAKNRIEELLNNQEVYKELSINASEYALENHSIKKMTDHFLNSLGF